MSNPTPSGVERKVQQLDNDVQAIYEMLARLEATQRRHTNRFDDIDGRFDGIEGRLDGIDGRLNGIDGKVDEVLRRLDRG
jgi:hypothetical protein